MAIHGGFDGTEEGCLNFRLHGSRSTVSDPGF